MATLPAGDNIVEAVSITKQLFQVRHGNVVSNT